MTLKKMLLILGAAMALVAFAAPAMAQADQWYTDVEVGEGEFEEVTITGEDEVTLTGSLSTSKGPVTNGPCAVDATVDLSNPSGVAAASVTAFNITGGCPVSLFGSPVAGCEIKSASSSGFPWTAHPGTGATGFSITGANFLNEYNGCGALGIPNGAKLGASGTATGTWSNSGTGCIVFNNDGDLKNPQEESVTINGSVCAENTVTLK